ncbi:hypothetical protein PSPO01_16549 [Paraphaeosphaeria sporulosa]
MRDPPGTIPPQRKTLNLRRPPAHQSVSLRHSPPASCIPAKVPTSYQPRTTTTSSPYAGASDQTNPPSGTSPEVQSNKHSSGESSDAGMWFVNTNNVVQSNINLDSQYRDSLFKLSSNQSDVDEPPFFLRNSSSSETPPDSHMHDMYQQTSMPHRPGLGYLNSESVEDFRSVIDDLTIANRKLEHKLRKYEKLHDAHLQDEKLFEVRFHGLPGHKKRELVETLRKFAADLDNNSGQGVPVITSHPPPFDAQKTASSHASRFAESGYASMSGHNSNLARSNQTSNTASSNNRVRRRMTKSQYNQQQQSIQSYLHDIPHGLIPNNHARTTEKSKKKLVVRRLEQIFTGKRSTPGNHPQPMQQEQVAQSAATADREAREATGQGTKTEGSREARIMPMPAGDEDITGYQEALQLLRPSLHINEIDFASSGSQDQRATRPLDLDPYRAQVPANNMDYIRHLGFTPPNMTSGDSPEDGHGWIYLNLLINMAQLHTLNVTPDFVKEAVTEFSTLFELSHDGREIRWRGGPDATLSSTGSSPEYQSNDSPEIYGNSRSPSKYLEIGSGRTDPVNSERAVKRLARQQKEKKRNKFHYTPLFFHKEDSEDENDSYGLDRGSSSNSPLQFQQAGDASGFGSSAMQSSSSKRSRNDGPMIFYSKAKFCTDLTGDSRGIATHTPDTYQNITSHPIGDPILHSGPSFRQSSDIAEPRGPLETTSLTDIDFDQGPQTFSSSEDMGFSPDALKDDNGTESSDLIEFEASGLGGVQPEDNFSIRVRRSQLQTAPGNAPFAKRRSQLYPKRIIEALNQRSSSDAEASSPEQQPVIKEKILFTSRKTLPSSRLPPASFLPFDSTSSGDVDSDLESNISSNPSTTSSSEKVATIALQPLNFSPMRREEGEESSSDAYSTKEEDSESDHNSIGLIMTAHQMNSAVAALNKEGEGSSKKNRPKRQSTTSGRLSFRAKLKRNRTRESIATALQGTKSPKSQKRDRDSI